MSTRRLLHPVRLPGHIWSKYGTSAFAKTVMLASVVLSLIYIPLLLAIWFHDPDIVSTASLRTERVSVDIVEPRTAAFFVAGFKAAPFGTSPASAACRSGIVTPAVGTSIVYGRVGREPVEITLAPPQDSATDVTVASFLPADGGKLERFQGLTYLSFDRSCNPPVSQRFPIWGRLHAGQEPRAVTSRDAVEPRLLIDGLLRVSAHSVFSDSLYEMTSLTIPVGSRLETYVPERQREAMASAPVGKSAIWWGTVIVDPDHVALDVAAATEAPHLALFRPYKKDADVVEISAVGQLITDPNIVDLHIVLGVLLFLLARCATMATSLHEREKRKFSDLT